MSDTKPRKKRSFINSLFIEEILSERSESLAKRELDLFPGTTRPEHLLIFRKHDGNLLAAPHCLQRESSPLHLFHVRLEPQTDGTGDGDGGGRKKKPKKKTPK